LLKQTQYSNIAKYISSGVSDSDKQYLDGLLFDLFKQPKEQAPNVFIHYGSKEPHLKSHIEPLLEQLRVGHYNVEIDIAEGGDRKTLTESYSKYLEQTCLKLHEKKLSHDIRLEKKNNDVLKKGMTKATGISKKIVENEQVFKDEVEVKYLYFPSYKDSDLLTITFAGFHAEGATPKYNYIRTLDAFDCNRLYLLDDFGSRGSYYMCKSRDFKIERSIKKLIDMICQEHGIKKKISLGSSKGGSAAIYYGIKYDFDAVIAGAPQFYIGSYLKKVKSANNVLEFMAGSQDEESIEYVDNIIKNVVHSKKQCLTKVIICVGKDDPHYALHSAPLIELLKEKGIFNDVEFLNYKKHSDIGTHFPESLKKNLALYGSFSILEDYNVKVEESILSLNLVTTSDEDKIAVYLYNSLKRKYIECTTYTAHRKYCFEIEKENEYILKIFIINKLGRRYVDRIKVGN
jgi:hypothetical protein